MRTVLKFALILICILSACWALKSLPRTLELMTGASALVDRPTYDATLNWTFRILRPVNFLLSMSLLVLAWGVARRRTWVLKFATIFLMLETVSTLVEIVVPPVLFWPHSELMPEGLTMAQMVSVWALTRLFFYLHPLSIWCLMLWFSKVTAMKNKKAATPDLDSPALNFELIPEGEQGNVSDKNTR